MRIKLTVIVLAVSAICAVPTVATAKAKPKSKPVYYLALGDSLAAGAQPNSTGKTVPTTQGYAYQLYAQLHRKYKKLRFVDLGCLGESTTTMMNGGICHYAGSKSQLAAAVKFIKTHKVAFITIDIGANDVDACAPNGTINFQCVAAGEKSIMTNVPKIAAALRKAGPKDLFVGMTYYDPFLEYYLKGGSDQAIAAASVSLAKQVNTDISNAYKGQHFRVALVDNAFDTYTPFSQTTTYQGKKVPVAVARICQLTWMCAPAPRGPNIHANLAGYKLIAATFKPEL